MREWGSGDGNFPMHLLDLRENIEDNQETRKGFTSSENISSCALAGFRTVR